MTDYLLIVDEPRSGKTQFAVDLAERALQAGLKVLVTGSLGKAWGEVYPNGVDAMDFLHPICGKGWDLIILDTCVVGKYNRLEGRAHHYTTRREYGGIVVRLETTGYAPDEKSVPLSEGRDILNNWLQQRESLAAVATP